MECGQIQFARTSFECDAFNIPTAFKRSTSIFKSDLTKNCTSSIFQLNSSVLTQQVFPNLLTNTQSTYHKQNLITCFFFYDFFVRVVYSRTIRLYTKTLFTCKRMNYLIPHYGFGHYIHTRKNRDMANNELAKNVCVFFQKWLIRWCNMSQSFIIDGRYYVAQL